MPGQLHRRRWILGATLFFTAFPMNDSTAADDRDKYEARTYRDAAGNKLRYRLLKPQNYDSKKKYPLVVFLHGAGERGDDNKAQLKHGAAEFASDAVLKKHPCFVVAPQCPAGARWVEVDWSSAKHAMPEWASSPLRMTCETVRLLEKEFSIDAQRRYITGLSMGGFGSWDAMQRHPDLFAAGAPVCGGGDPNYAARMAAIPVWAFHGDKDGVVKVERSRDMVAALQAAGGSPKYTEYPGGGHDAWTATYKNPELLDWLFAQRRKK